VRACVCVCVCAGKDANGQSAEERDATLSTFRNRYAFVTLMLERTNESLGQCLGVRVVCVSVCVRVYIYATV
jgi:hypothetical protein